MREARGVRGAQRPRCELSYEEAIAFLEGRIKFGMRPGTERVEALVEALGNPQHSYPVVQVSGTNAKFSVVSIAGAILAELGLTVGTYSSPHLETVRERIALAGSPISREDFAATLSYLEPYITDVETRLNDQLTYFELLTVMAFEAFFDRAVHAALLEVGLGGEYDATNVANAQVGVVTNVSLDHVRQFGRDLNKAAWEKGGIAKQGTFIVSGVEQDDLFSIIAERATERGASGVARLGHEIDVVERQPAVGGQFVTIRGLHASYRDVFVSLFGEHQGRNTALAVAACEAFAGEALDVDSVSHALGAINIPGRVEVIGRHPLIVCDGAHNIAASSAVREAIEESFSYDRLLLVAGMVETKLVEDVLAIWAPLISRGFATAPSSDRAAAPERVAAALKQYGAGDVTIVAGVGNALSAALGEATDDDLVLVLGSFYTVGEARAWLRSQGVLTEA